MVQSVGSLSFQAALVNFLDLFHLEATSPLPDSTDHIHSYTPQSDPWPLGSSNGAVRIKSPSQGHHSGVDEGEASTAFLKSQPKN